MPLNQATSVLLAKSSELDGTIERLTSDVTAKSLALADSESQLNAAQSFKAEITAAIAKLRAP